ncbi:MAG: hypothetical protein OMM_13736 [Candidatus Magnetoglobus multicellularis str. Araruama]|uniref:Uncharacterized protein n=1 Tax=Candidatus Magnetoglobus multicellularis str. Araruama TaxID=890399 RepID=A0A1V1NT81_9BACT|nr:MAG: hypothetical protein OMM_13736 [Candidatus Magnetoglobus multicellularis str. Araruama]
MLFQKQKSNLYIKKKNLQQITFLNTAGGDKNDFALSVQQTTDEGYIVAAITESFNSGDSDILVVKYSRQGNIEWAKTIGGKNRDIPLHKRKSMNRIWKQMMKSLFLMGINLLVLFN